nr:hypothetical protein [Heyndrickxia oleronia]
MLIDDLLIELKDRLLITWEDESTNRNLTQILKRGMKYFNEFGKEFSFDEDSSERELLLERCRYVWNNALNDFEENFHSELNRLTISVALEKLREETPNGS